MNISDAEWQVMQVVWKRRSATAAEVVAEVCPETGWSHRTVRTLLARLVEKGALSTVAEGKRYIYRATVSRARCIRDESRSFLKRVFSGDAAELLTYFARDAEITPEQLDELKRILRQKQAEGEGS